MFVDIVNTFDGDPNTQTHGTVDIVNQCEALWILILNI